ncbi:MAG TPA: alpha/beta hydrolase [Opitutus sp.]|nr:alpha/beta hydrolase [Opitutus sp.]
MNSPTVVQTGYAPVNGLRLYYEIHGTARPGRVPLVLLHGGGDTIGTSFGQLLPVLARERQVIAFEQQGFGHTADIADRPFTFEQSADDTIALLDYLHIVKADLLGFSNGGTIILQVAIRHPGRVRRLVPISTIFSRAGCEPGFWTGFDHVTLAMMPKELRDAYVAVAPHPENLQSFFDKCVRRMKEFKDIPEEKIRGIAAPTLVVCGDKDVVRPEHAVALFRLLRHAQIAIVPGAEHMALTSRVDLLGPMIERFLDGAPA